MSKDKDKSKKSADDKTSSNKVVPLHDKVVFEKPEPSEVTRKMLEALESLTERVKAGQVDILVCISLNTKSDDILVINEPSPETNQQHAEVIGLMRIAEDMILLTSDAETDQDEEGS